MKTIKLSNNNKCKNSGKFSVILDDDDYFRLKNYNWYADKKNNREYARTNINDNSRKCGKFGLFLHREIMNADKSELVFFLDNNGLNCQKNNLIKLPKDIVGKHFFDKEKKEWIFYFKFKSKNFVDGIQKLKELSEN